MGSLALIVYYCQRQTAVLAEILKRLDGSSGIEMRRLPLPCSGKLEVFYLTKALENGADGVALFGCPEDQCCYFLGSKRAERRVGWTGKILAEIGLERERVRRFTFSQPPGPEEIAELSTWLEKIGSMAPLPKKGQDPPEGN